MDPTHLHQIAVEAMRSRGLLPTFAPQALQEAEAARHTDRESNSTILDLRHLTWFSIDNDDTRDLDQLSVAEPLPAGAVRLLVAVADVDCLVRPGGAGESPGSGLEFILFQCRKLVLEQSYHTRFPQSLRHQISLQPR